MVYLLIANNNSFTYISKYIIENNIQNYNFVLIDSGMKYYDKITNKKLIKFAIGDFDSFNFKNFKQKKYENLKVILKTEQLHNDLEYALMYLKKNFSKSISKIICFASGKRWDQQLINLKLLYKYDFELIDKNNKCFLIKKSATVKKNNYRYISFFAFKNVYVNSNGLLFEMKNYLINVDTTTTISNEFKKDEVFLNISDSLIVMLTNN